MKKLKLYLETSVWNFYYAEEAPEKPAITRQFFHSLPTSPFRIYASDVVIDEINRAALDKRNQLLQLIDIYQPTMLIMNPAADELVNSYLAHQVLPAKSLYDARHIAMVTVYELEVIVSWNLRHLANLNRQQKVQTVNLQNGYTKPLHMITPMEVINL